MISTLSASSAGQTKGYISLGRSQSRYINIHSYRNNILAPSAIGTQPTDSGSSIYSVSWSSTGSYFIVASDDTSGIKFFSRSGETFTDQSVPSNIDAAYGDCAISSNGLYCAAISSNLGSNTGRIYHNNAGTLTNLTSVGSFTSNSRSCAISSDGKYAAFLGQTSPTFLRIKIRSGTGNSATYSDMSLASQPTSGGSAGTILSGLSFTPDDVYLAVCPSAQADQAIYKFNSGTSVYEKLSSPFVGSLPDDSVFGCSFSAQGDFLAIATSSKTFFYERSGDTFTAIANVTGGLRGNFHPSGNYYITGSSRIYKKVSSSNWQATSTTSIVSSCLSSAFSPYI